jgi:hypothetical protein
MKPLTTSGRERRMKGESYCGKRETGIGTCTDCAIGERRDTRTPPPKGKRQPGANEKQRISMVNREELLICRKRGHSVTRPAWSQCQACHLWVREVTTIEEREDTPAANERGTLFEILIRLGKVQIDDHRIDPGERAICSRRGHSRTGSGSEGFEPCAACGTWLREVRTIEEREDEPSPG